MQQKPVNRREAWNEMYFETNGSSTKKRFSLSILYGKIIHRLLLFK
ncbi:MAG: hypothetical protein ABS948_12135 [Solibacillus sp.]